MNRRIAEDLPGVASGDGEEPAEPRPAPVAVSLGDLNRPPPDDPNELLRHRFLCRGAGLLLVGPTGIGKSSLSMQCMLLWSLGRPAFGIEPTRPLKSLLIQAENDEGDLAEMRDGVVNGLSLQEEERTAAFSRITVCREQAVTGDGFFAHTVRGLLEVHRPDLVWIDPALAYLGGEANSQEAVGAFLRNGLNPLLQEFNCAAVVVHHTNKPVRKEGNGSGSTDSAYLGAGSAEWANWPRAVLALKSTPSPGIFELCAGKRGGRLQWRAPDETTRLTSRFIAHAMGDGEIYWRPATEAEVESTQGNGKCVASSDLGNILAAIPHIESIEKKRLIKVCKARGIGRDRATELIKQLVDEGRLKEIEVPRAGQKARAEVHLIHVTADRQGANPNQPPVDPPSLPPKPPTPPAGACPVVGAGERAELQSAPVVPGCSYGPITASNNSRNNQPDDEVPPPGLLLLPAPLKGAVGTAGTSSSGRERENHPPASQNPGTAGAALPLVENPGLN